ncbi:hypothetical protein F4802DRAFT_611273 [Xylaria palmicola]|nr:hypothetical protein F4802DRAFT_611273 [Xylaria palmicola]
MQPPFPCPVETWRNDTYETISPSCPELSAANKTVVILGAGSGIGQETALAFAAAGASKIALLGRTEAALKVTAGWPKERCIRIGKWNVLVLCSGFCPTLSPIASAEVDDWWKGFETNVKGTLLVAKAFLPTAHRPGAAFLAIISDVSVLPAAHLPGLSPYISSKLAQAKMFEFLAAENPDIFVATMHPGMVKTDIFDRTGGKADQLPMDKVQLPAHFLVWMASPEAAFLRGRCASCNWDVEELKAQKAMFTNGLFMTFGSKGLP